MDSISYSERVATVAGLRANLPSEPSTVAPVLASRPTFRLRGGRDAPYVRNAIGGEAHPGGSMYCDWTAGMTPYRCP